MNYTPETKLWVDIADKFGVSFLILLFLGVVAWRLVPKLIARLEAATKQSNALSEAMPNIERNIGRMADSNESTNSICQRIDAKVDLIHGIVSKDI